MTKDAGVKKQIMNHLPNVEVDEEATKKAVSNNYKGKIIFAKDLLVITSAN